MSDIIIKVVPLDRSSLLNDIRMKKRKQIADLFTDAKRQKKDKAEAGPIEAEPTVEQLDRPNQEIVEHNELVAKQQVILFVHECMMKQDLTKKINCRVMVGNTDSREYWIQYSVTSYDLTTRDIDYKDRECTDVAYNIHTDTYFLQDCVRWIRQHIDSLDARSHVSFGEKKGNYPGDTMYYIDILCDVSKL